MPAGEKLLEHDRCVSNNNFCVPATLVNRRFFILDVSNSRKGDKGLAKSITSRHLLIHLKKEWLLGKGKKKTLTAQNEYPIGMMN